MNAKQISDRGFCKQAILILLLLGLSNANAFDVSGWKHDPLTIAKYWTNTGPCSDETKIANISQANDSMIQWCDELGMDYFVVEWPDEDEFYQPLLGHDVQAVSLKFPDIIKQRYFLSQRRYVTAIDYQDTEYGYWRRNDDDLTIGRIGEDVDDAYHFLTYSDPQYQAGLLWKPTCIGVLEGWGSGTPMPIHLNIHGGGELDPNDQNIDIAKST